MKYSLSYSSATGNTKLLAEAVEAALAQETKVEDAKEADLVCIGFWTDQGTADKASRDTLKSLSGSKVFLFGSAGFGDSQTYFNGILENAEDNLNESNEVIGTFMCQGKMPQAFRDKYEKDKEEVPNQGAHYDLMITNFDKALSHPDAADLEGVKKAVLEAVKKLG